MPDALRHLFVGWNEVARRLRNAPSIALFLDFDGTLSPLRPRPEDVRLSGSMRSIVSNLARKAHVRVWVISGRRRADGARDDGAAPFDDALAPFIPGFRE